MQPDRLIFRIVRHPSHSDFITTVVIFRLSQILIDVTDGHTNQRNVLQGYPPTMEFLIRILVANIPLCVIKVPLWAGDVSIINS